MVALSIPPCRSLCQEVNANCATEFAIFGVSPLDCLSIDGRSEYWTFPEESIVYEFPGGMTVTLPCNSMQLDADGFFPNALINPGFEEMDSNAKAVNWNSIYSLDDYVLLNDSSQVVLMINNGSWYLGASQSVELNRNEPLKIRFGLASKAENVSGTLSETYAIRLTVNYTDNTQEEAFVFFQPGTHDYEIQQSLFTPSQPIKSATFSFLFSEREGAAYFDNATLQEQIPGNDCFFIDKKKVDLF